MEEDEEAIAMAEEGENASLRPLARDRQVQNVFYFARSLFGN